MRLALAASVAVAHGLQLAIGWQPVLGSATELGSLAVDAFFVISGYLVTSSMMRLRSVRRYAWHRALRIMPGFWVCLIVTAFLIAPILAAFSGRSALGVLTADPSAVSYLTRNVALLMRQFDIGGLGPSVPGGGVVNGALWTLFYEAVCYLAVAVLGLLGVLRRRWLVLALVVVLQLLTVAQAAGLVAVPQERLLRLMLVFLLGACAQLYADRIRLSLPLALTAGSTLLVAVAILPDYRALGAAGFAYLTVGAAARSPFVWDPGFDLSYGVYVYHWPIALVVLTATGGSLPVALVPVVVLLAAAAVAAVSWFTVESTALRFKSARWVTAPVPAFARLRRDPASARSDQGE